MGRILLNSYNYSQYYNVTGSRSLVILRKDAHELWLDPGLTEVAVLSDLLKPYDASRHALLSGEQQDQSSFK